MMTMRADTIQLPPTVADIHPAILILDELKSTLIAKAHDYATDLWDDNFTGTAHLTGLEPEQVFHALVGIKIERLRSLVGGGKEAENEPIDDTLVDLANYAILWLAYRRQNQPESRVDPPDPVRST